MQESFLHFVWKHQRFDTQNLFTTEHQPIELQQVGHHNHDAGPDFLQVKLLIEQVKWYGSVEIHLRASDWERHGHHRDPKYNTTILHVVWENDKDCCREDGGKIPALELKNRVDPALVKRCNELINHPSTIPCETQFDKVREIEKISMLDLAAVARLKRKSAVALEMLEANRGDWEETAYQLIAQNFGFKKNSQQMLKLAQRLPHKILVKHQGNLAELEALLYGMAGFLDDGAQDQYHENLHRHYSYLSKKYRLKEKQMLRVEWDFLRMRPSNFPTIRLAQLARFFHQNSKFFQALIHQSDVKTLREYFATEHNEYWKKHYDFGKESRRPMRGLGAQSVGVLLINSVVVLLVAYAQYTADQRYMDRAVDLLQSLSPEQNRIVDDWGLLGLKAKSAFDSQALIELKNEFCLKKKCLSCKIGLKLISH